MTGRARLAALALAAAAAACSAPAPAPSDAGGVQGPRVVLESPSGRSRTVNVELARTPEEQARGLMFRDRLAEDAGMLFIFPDSSDHAFWMKNTLIPLDMIFIDEAGTVVGIVERAEPQTLTPRSVGARSRYVLEVNGGWSAANGFGKGDRARFENVPGL
ncbi:MAG TPA: DUF192 domain-containing protein [Anaeromyxobacteraceae bacterium]|nr:DUF192 domain-containing protein [Anaeromyxobacteraceae bacterium]